MKFHGFLFEDNFDEFNFFRFHFSFLFDEIKPEHFNLLRHKKHKIITIFYSENEQKWNAKRNKKIMITLKKCRMFVLNVRRPYLESRQKVFSYWNRKSAELVNSSKQKGKETHLRRYTPTRADSLTLISCEQFLTRNSRKQKETETKIFNNNKVDENRSTNRHQHAKAHLIIAVDTFEL